MVFLLCLGQCNHEFYVGQPQKKPPGGALAAFWKLVIGVFSLYSPSLPAPAAREKSKNKKRRIGC